jgi:hypothetical protein
MDRSWEESPAELAKLLSLSDEDPRRRALANDPKFQAALAEYRAFIDPGDVPEGASVAAAERSLTDALRKEIFGAAAADRRESVPRTGLLGRLRDLWQTPGMRPALGFIMAGIAFGGVYLATKWSGAETARIGSLVIEPAQKLRSASSPTVAGGVPLLPATRNEAGEIVLRWRRVQGADTYTVTVYTPGYAVLARVGPMRDTVATVPDVSWPAGERAANLIFWQVTASRGEEKLAESAVGDAPRP